MIHADGTETRIRWKAAQWNAAARYFLTRFPQLCTNPELPGLSISDVMDMQQAVIEPHLHRPKTGMHLKNVRALVWRQLELIRAEAEPKAEERVLPDVVETHVPAGSTPVFKDLTAKDASEAKVEEQDEGESQLMFLDPVKSSDDHPAYSVEKLLGSMGMPAPLPEGAKLNLDWMNRPMTPGMAMQEVSQMSINTVLDLIADKVAERVALRMEAVMANQVMSRVNSNPAAKQIELNSKPAANPVQEKKVEAKQAVLKPEDKGSLKDQLISLAKQTPKLRKPKIVIIGMQPGQAKDIDREFSMFDIVHVGHANDNAMAKLESAHKVIGVEQKLGTYQRKIRQMHGTNFALLKFSMTSIRHQLSVWNTCYNEDPDYFKMNEVERRKANDQFAHA